ncbi:septum formation initiator [Corynebacterium endometrii]|uniref:Serine transporter n=1 Tax=Corynebacterium endometrii TaxID=2488819 RepID=A0A4V1CEE7_9CORY|nr:septum formation initiator [Corynebacterium endometrii]QCB27848.1 Serine transporter [Corynebacterium endometrii]
MAIKETALQRPEPPTETKGSNGSTLSWVITLFGTAVGAGILFLPLNAGSFGFWPLTIATLIILPLVYFSHRTFARIIAGVPEDDHGKDVLELTTKYLGRGLGAGIAFLYWLAIFPIVLIYGVSITNSIDSFIVNQFGGPSIPRPVLAVACVGLMTLVFAFGRKPMMAFTQALVYPLIFSLGAVSIYLIPTWDFNSFVNYNADQSGTSIIYAIMLVLPMLVFAFNHFPAVSQFCVDVQRGHGSNTLKQVEKTEFYASLLLVIFTMFFVWSCVLSLGAEGMNEAIEQNLPVLSYFANVTDAPLMSWIAPIVVICAIISSFFGHMLGTEEGTEYLVRAVAPRLTARMSRRALLNWIYFGIFIATTLTAIFNPSVIDMISVVGGIFVAFLVYLLPVMLFRKLKVYEKFRNDPVNYFVFVMGLIVMAGAILDMIR